MTEDIAHIAPTVPILRLEAFLALALRQGWEISSILQEAGVSPALLVDGRSRVTAGQLSAVVRALWRQTDDELFGLGTSPMPRGTFRLIGCAMLFAATDLGTVMTRVTELHRVLPSVPPICMQNRDSQVAITFDTSKTDAPPQLLIDGFLAVAHRLAEWAVGGHIQLSGVEVPYGRLDGVDDYGQIFDAPVHFHADTAALIVDRTVLSMAIVRNGADFDGFVRRAPEDLLVRPRREGMSMADRVRRLAEQSIGGQWLTTVEMSRKLAVSAQTIRRRLQEENTSVRRIRDDVLRDAAVESLARGDETVAALSERLGFSEPSAFTRAFRRWTGSAPRWYRPYP